MRDKFMEIMQEHGYSSQRAVARALHDRIEYYRDRKSNPKTTAVFLNQILWGKRPMPSHLAEGLVELCEGDERLTSLLEHTEASKTKGNVQYHLTQVLGQYYDELKFYYVSIDDSEKLKLLTDFQSFVRSYTGLEAKLTEEES
jgi:hypothetical protein